MALRVLVTGDRNYRCDDLAREILGKVIEKHGRDITLVHGCGAGVDAAFADAAREFGLRVEPHFADWKNHDQIAGPLRNQAMVNAGASFCLAVHSALAYSKGTRDCVRRCLEAGIPVFLFPARDTSYVRVTRAHLGESGGTRRTRKGKEDQP